MKDEKSWTVLENIAEGYYETDLRGNYSFCNEAYSKILALPKEKIIGSNYKKLIGAEAVKIFPIFQGVHLTGKPAKSAYRKVTRPDGSQREIEFSVSLIKDENGAPIGFRGIVRDITEQKQVQEALRQSEERYRTILENIEDGYHEVDLKGNFTFFNEPYRNMMGYTREELLGINFRHFADRENVQKVLKAYHQVYRTGKPLERVEWEIIRKDGARRNHAFSVSLIKDTSSQPIGFRGIVRDETDQKEAKEALIQSEKKYRDIFENSVEGIYQATLEGKFLNVNPAMARICGYDSPDEMIGDIDIGQQIYVHPEEREKFLIIIQEQDIIEGHEFQGYRKDKSKMWISANVRTVRDSTGRILYLQGMCLDITEKKQAEKALKASEERFRVLFNSAADCILIMDPAVRDDPVIIEANQAAYVMHGYAPGELIGKPISLLDAPESRKQIPERVALLMSGRHLTGEAGHVRKDGSVFPVEISAQRIQINGKPFIQAIDRDLTERKRAEEEKTKLESQLRQAQKMEAIGTLAGGIAHDFNNILTVIIGCTDLALVDIPEEHPIYQHLRLVREAGTRATDLVKQILAFSRQAEQEQKPIRLGSIVKEALKMLRSSLPSTIQIRQAIEDHGLVMADPTQIHQILINLCTNAAHAMREKGGLLEVRLTNARVETGSSGKFPDLSPGHYVNLTVSDTGHGMEPEIMERIFDPYFTTKAVGEGAGLGLAVVYGIVKSTKGAVKVHSQPGRGSLFEVFLPRIEYAQQEMKTGEYAPVPGGSESILLVDDEEALVYAVQKMLERLGYQVTAGTNSLEALETFRTRPQDFDCLITDMTMPHMTGVDLSKRIKQIRPDIPMVLCTGFSEMIDEKKARALGFRAFVMKPIVLRDIAETIRKALDRQNAE